MLELMGNPHRRPTPQTQQRHEMSLSRQLIHRHGTNCLPNNKHLRRRMSGYDPRMRQHSEVATDELPLRFV
jgi:hypothetical protein